MPHPTARDQCPPCGRHSARTQCVVAMRLHALLFAAGHTSMVAISRATKTDAFILDYHLPFMSTNEGVRGDELIAHVKDALNNRSAVAEAHSIRAAARMAALGRFKHLPPISCARRVES